jgi:hypothetical protein
MLNYKNTGHTPGTENEKDNDVHRHKNSQAVHDTPNTTATTTKRENTASQSPSGEKRKRKLDKARKSARGRDEAEERGVGAGCRACRGAEQQVIEGRQGIQL